MPDHEYLTDEELDALIEERYQEATRDQEQAVRDHQALLDDITKVPIVVDFDIGRNWGKRWVDMKSQEAIWEDERKDT
jgi:hypothetical protein